MKRPAEARQHLDWPNSNHRCSLMVEANPSLTQARRLAQRQAQAARVLCERRAQEEIKDQIRRQGKIKLSKVPRHEIIAEARARLFEDVEYRSRLIEEAKLIVGQWRREGFFGKRAAQAPKEPQDKEKCGGTILTGHTLRQSVTTSPQASEVSQ